MNVYSYFHVVTRDDWRIAATLGVHHGGPADRDDGFIHLSTKDQVPQTLARHFPGQDDLLLMEIAAQHMPVLPYWEEGENGELFPHLYDSLPLSAIRRVHALALDENGVHAIPALA